MAFRHRHPPGPEDEIAFGGVPRDPPGQLERDGFLPATSPLRRITTPTVVAFAGGRALLMELAHPSIAQAVSDFDQFQVDPARRARLTVLAMVRAIHGSEQVADGVRTHLRGVHAAVRGPTYRASDPDLVLWVHATFIDSMLRLSGPLGRPLSPSDEERAYSDAVQLGGIFGLDPSAQPATLAAMRKYVGDTADSLTVTPTAQALARLVFHPRVPASRRPLLALYRQVSVATLPTSLRDQYDGISRAPRRGAWTIARRVAPHIAPQTDAALRHLGRDGAGISRIIGFFRVGDGQARRPTAERDTSPGGLSSRRPRR